MVDETKCICRFLGEMVTCYLSKIKFYFLICNDFLPFPVHLQPSGAEEDLTTIILTLKLIGRQFVFDTNSFNGIYSSHYKRNLNFGGLLRVNSSSSSSSSFK